MRVCAQACLYSPWTVGHQAPLSMGLYKQEYWICIQCVYLYIILLGQFSCIAESGTEVQSNNESDVKLLVAHLSDSLWPPGPTVARQAPLSMRVSRQEYWSGFPFSSPRDLPDPGIEPGSPTLQADSLTSKPPQKPKGIRRH